MRIESLRRRPGGSRITLDGVEYHFLADVDGREFAEVDNTDHAAKLLSIPEGFRAADPVVAEDIPDVEIPTESEVIQPADEVVLEVASEEVSDDGNPVVEETVEGEADIPESLADDRDYWVEQFQARFGRKPHGRWSIERIRAELESE